MAEPLPELENAILAQSLTDQNGQVHAPLCCDTIMVDDGGCSNGCCDDYRCERCGKRIRIQWPD